MGSVIAENAGYGFDFTETDFLGGPYCGALSPVSISGGGKKRKRINTKKKRGSSKRKNRRVSTLRKKRGSSKRKNRGSFKRRKHSKRDVVQSIMKGLSEKRKSRKKSMKGGWWRDNMKKARQQEEQEWKLLKEQDTGFGSRVDGWGKTELNKKQQKELDKENKKQQKEHKKQQKKQEKENKKQQKALQKAMQKRQDIYSQYEHARPGQFHNVNRERSLLSRIFRRNKDEGKTQFKGTRPSSADVQTQGGQDQFNPYFEK